MIREGTRVHKFGDHELPAVLDLTYLGPHGWPGAYLVNRINVPNKHRGEGVAGKMFRKLCDEADRADIYLVLEIQPGGGLTHEQLKEWYIRLGFEEGSPWPKDAGRHMWYRQPKKEAT